MTFIFKTFLYLAIAVGVFHPLNAQTPFTLEKVLKTAKRNNPVLKSEHYNVAIAESDILSAELRPNLVLSNETIQIANSSDFENSTNYGNPENREVLWQRSEEHTSELQSRPHLVCRLLL